MRYPPSNRFGGLLFKKPNKGVTLKPVTVGDSFIQFLRSISQETQNTRSKLHVVAELCSRQVYFGDKCKDVLDAFKKISKDVCFARTDWVQDALQALEKQCEARKDNKRMQLILCSSFFEQAAILSNKISDFNELKTLMQIIADINEPTDVLIKGLIRATTRKGKELGVQDEEWFLELSERIATNFKAYSLPLPVG